MPSAVPALSWRTTLIATTAVSVASLTFTRRRAAIKPLNWVQVSSFLIVLITRSCRVFGSLVDGFSAVLISWHSALNLESYVLNSIANVELLESSLILD